MKGVVDMKALDELAGVVLVIIAVAIITFLLLLLANRPHDESAARRVALVLLLPLGVLSEDLKERLQSFIGFVEMQALVLPHQLELDVCSSCGCTQTPRS